jgi:hypothetical protein
MLPKRELEERVLGLLMGIGIGTVLGFLLRDSEHPPDLHREDSIAAARPVPIMPAVPLELEDLPS